VFKNAEEREAERRAREAERARAEFMATPVGAATVAMEKGQTFFEVQLEVGGHTGSAGFGSADGRRHAYSSAAILGRIEKLGWRLEHASYFFMVTGETSSKHMLVSGDETAISGVTIGVYLFRNHRLPG
jgi:hypothetical protein